jgi:hypothetical protein
MGRKVRLTNEQRTVMLQQINDDATVLHILHIRQSLEGVLIDLLLLLLLSSQFMCSLGIMDYSILLGIHFIDKAAGHASQSAAAVTDHGAGASSQSQQQQRLVTDGGDEDAQDYEGDDDRRPLLHGDQTSTGQRDLESGSAVTESTLGTRLAVSSSLFHSLFIHTRASIMLCAVLWSGTRWGACFHVLACAVRACVLHTFTL